jgi:hypothetical protein
MARLQDLDIADLQSGQVAALRAALGDVEFANRCQPTAAEIHSALASAWGTGDRALHDLLLIVGWLVRRYEWRLG